jgi:5-methylcytosine-specific restriction enzyme A
MARRVLSQGLGLNSGSTALSRKAGKKRNAPWLDPDWRSWYQLERWRRLRRIQLRKEPLCAFCLKGGIVIAATIADHVESHGGDWTAFLTGKLQSLCAPCHSRKDGRVQELDDDGWPLVPGGGERTAVPRRANL